MFYLDFVQQKHENLRGILRSYCKLLSLILLIYSSKSSKFPSKCICCRNSTFSVRLIVQNVKFTLKILAISPWGVSCNISKYCTMNKFKIQNSSYFSEIQYFHGDYATKLWKLNLNSTFDLVIHAIIFHAVWSCGIILRMAHDVWQVGRHATISTAKLQFCTAGYNFRLFLYFFMHFK